MNIYYCGKRRVYISFSEKKTKTSHLAIPTSAKSWRNFKGAAEFSVADSFLDFMGDFKGVTKKLVVQLPENTRFYSFFG